VELFTDRILWVRDIDPHRIAVTSCPPGEGDLAAHVAGWKAEGIDLVVSLQQPDERARWGVTDEDRHCERMGIAFRSFPIVDHDVPESVEAFAEFTREMHQEVISGKAMLAHCLAGIGRTGLLTSGVLFLLGVPRASIGEVLRRSRGFAMPETAEQRAWLEAFYDVLSGSR
jgi:protein-tyrosine phosphatase